MMQLKVLTAFLVVLGLAGPVHAVAEDVSDVVAYRETFDNGSRPLGGIIKLGTDGNWNISATDGTVVFLNDENDASLRYYDITAARFPYGVGVQSTRGSEPSARVRVGWTHDGGAGLLVGYPVDGNYLGFAIGDRQHFTVVQKAAGRLRKLSSGTNEAIRPQEFNLLTVEREGATLRFMINGVEVFSVAAGELETAPIGIIAFGRGSFAFDEVSVAAPPTVVEDILNGRAPCALPAAGADDLVALVGSYGGTTTSSVTVGGQDETTSTVALRIESGDAPIYAVVSSYSPMIWRFDGAVSRISHVAVIGRPIEGGIAGGVVGVPGAKVSFHSENDCFQHFDAVGRSEDTAALTVMRTLHRDIDKVVAAEEPLRISLPSGATIPGKYAVPVGLDPRWDPDLAANALRFAPGGVYRFRADDVVSTPPAEPYIVLPQEFGLADMVADGIAVVEPKRTFRIVRPLARFPADLAGAHAVKFFLEDDLPFPAGSLGHSEVTIDSSPRATESVKAPSPDVHRLDLADGTYLEQGALRPYPRILVCGAYADEFIPRLQAAFDTLAPGAFSFEAPSDPRRPPFGTTVLYLGSEDPGDACGEEAGRLFRSWVARHSDQAALVGTSTSCSFSRSLIRSTQPPFYNYAAAYVSDGTLKSCLDDLVLTLLDVSGTSPGLHDAAYAQIEDVRNFILERLGAR